MNHAHLTLDGGPPFHEAVAFAILGCQMLRGRPGNLP
jgi:hypothetical protein